MTIDEAIKHCEEKITCTECGQEHAQLRDWLIELREMKKQPEWRYGKWKNTSIFTIEETMYIAYCPVCEQRVVMTEWFDYCPYCGAEVKE